MAGAATNKRVGVATLVVDDTSVPELTYTGRVVDGERDGRGTGKWAKGDTYDGVWLNGSRTGRGVYKWPSGGTREGEWLNNVAAGTRGCGGTATGEGERTTAGWGVQRWRKTTTTGRATTAAMVTVYEGEWDRLKWHGVGTWWSPDGSGDIYHGQFDHGVKCGTGRILFGGGGDGGGSSNQERGGGSYIGEWKDDEFHGRGVRLWANGDRYDGQWVGGKEHGEGTKTWSGDGSSFTGLWEGGVPTKGMRRWPNGDKFEGTFTQNGCCCGEGVATLSSSSSSSSNLLKGTLNNNLFEGVSPPGVQHQMGSSLPQFEHCQLIEEEDDDERKSNLVRTTHPELRDAFESARLLQSQLLTLAPEIILLQESLTKLNGSLQRATESHETLASQLKKLTELKCALVRKLNESDDACKKLLGQTLTVQNSESEIKECARNISTLTKKVVWGIRSSTMSSTSEMDTVSFKEEGGDYNTVDAILMKPLTVNELQVHQSDHTFTPPFQLLRTLSDTLAQLQRCQFEECTKLADKHTVLSKELSEQVSIGGTLHKAIEEAQRECSELQRESNGKWKLQRGLEGDERFIGIPGVWSMLSELLPQAQQAIVDLMVSKATLSSSASFGGRAGTTLPGCTATSPSSSSSVPNRNNNESNVCMECDERPPDVQLQPCGHVVLCSQRSWAHKYSNKNVAGGFDHMHTCLRIHLNIAAF
ncbi:MORN motif protein [Pelomyxa schiedti]|nr:MORN motif protein [Pelomyxa schiedti]